MALIISEAQTRKLIDMQTALKLVDAMFGPGLPERCAVCRGAG